MKYGAGLSVIIKIGMFLQMIISRIEHLLRNVEESLMLHNLHESFPSSTREDVLKNQKKTILKILTEAKDINEMIKGSNEIIKLLGHKKKIVPIDLIAIRRFIQLRFKSIHKKEETQKLDNENFRIKVRRQFYKTKKSVKDFIVLVEEEQNFEGLDKLKKNYKKGINAAINIYSIGYYKTSIFVVGCTVEEVLDDLIRSAIKKGRLKRVNVSQIKYEKKIGILKNNRLIDDKLFHDLSSVRIDRNKTGHPIKRAFKKNENKLVILTGINLILRLQKILRKLENS